MLYGYRCCEVKLPSIPETNKSAKITSYDRCDGTIRKPVAVSSGSLYSGGTFMHPDQYDVDSTIGGIRKRFAVKCPEPDRKMLRRLSRFVFKWLRENLQPLARDTDTSFETWLSNTNYPKGRRRQLNDLYLRIKDNPVILKSDKLVSIKSFVKDEFYPEFKYPRCINARSDEFKVLVGPIFKCIERELFSLPWFIKKIPVDERSQYIVDHVYQPGANIITTDYSQFEAHFTPEIMRTIEFQLYDYMIEFLPDRDWWRRLIEQLLSRNVCKFKNIKVEIDGVRMSGEMNTSLGNGFSNLMLMLFAAEEHQLQGLKGVVEGDDGLFSFYSKTIPTEQWFQRLGWTIKLKHEKNISTASFCGLMFDLDDRDLIYDPFKFIMTYGWLKSKYINAKPSVKLALLKGKMMSVLSQTPNCPIVSALAFSLLKRLKSIRYNISFMNNYQVEMFKKIDLQKFCEPVIRTNTRLLFEDVYGITVSDQLELEKFFLDNDMLKEWTHPTFDKYVALDNIIVFQNYVDCFEAGRDRPTLRVAQYDTTEKEKQQEKQEESTTKNRRKRTSRRKTAAF